MKLFTGPWSLWGMLHSDKKWKRVLAWVSIACLPVVILSQTHFLSGPVTPSASKPSVRIEAPATASPSAPVYGAPAPVPVADSGRAAQLKALYKVHGYDGLDRQFVAEIADFNSYSECVSAYSRNPGEWDSRAERFIKGTIHDVTVLNVFCAEVSQ